MGFFRGTLEGIIAGFGDLDPGYILTSLEYKWGNTNLWESTRTVGGDIVRFAYSRINESELLPSDYFGRGVGREIGTLVGFGGIGAAFYGLYLINPLIAAGTLVTVGATNMIYALVNKLRNPPTMRSTFKDGYRLGFQRGINFSGCILHDSIYRVSGLVPSETRWESDIAYASTYSGNNFSSLIGGFVGSIVGGIAGLIPFLNTWKNNKSFYRTVMPHYS